MRGPGSLGRSTWGRTSSGRRTTRRLFESAAQLRAWDHLDKLYLGVCLVAVIPYLLLQAPLQTPDGIAHFQRAVEVAHGEIIGHKLRSGGAGGMTPVSVQSFFLLFNNIPFHIKVLATPAEMTAAHHLHWNNRYVVADNWNTASYPFYFYLPQALAIDAARVAGASLLTAYRLACAVDAVVAIGMSWLALRLARVGRTLLLVVLCLPMTLSEYFSVSDEALLLPCVFLFFGLLSHALCEPPPDRRSYQRRVIILDLLAVLVNGARPIYIAMLLAPLLIRPPQAVASLSGRAWLMARRSALVAGVVSLGLAAGWYALDASKALVPPPIKGVSSHRQLHQLLNHPGRILPLIGHTISGNWLFYWHSMEGVLGYLDTVLPGWLYPALGACLVAAVAVGDRGSPPGPGRLWSWRAVGAAVVISGVVLSEAAEYLTWTPVGAHIIEGVQGRYLLPLLPFLALVAVPSRPPGISRQGALQAVALGLPVFLGITTVLVAGVLFRRFWGF